MQCIATKFASKSFLPFFQRFRPSKSSDHRTRSFHWSEERDYPVSSRSFPVSKDLKISPVNDFSLCQWNYSKHMIIHNDPQRYFFFFGGGGVCEVWSTFINYFLRKIAIITSYFDERIKL